MADHLDGDIQLTVRHVPFLVEHLSGNASVWRSLGTALQFQQGDLDNIQACLPLISNSPYSFMQRLVEEWLEGKYPHAAPPTLANLLKALNSHTVGLGTLATQIRDSLLQHDQSVDAKVYKIASVSNQGDVTLDQSEVNEDTRVLIRVNINSETQKCKWNNTGLIPMYERKWNNGYELMCNELYSDTDQPTLCIKKADIDMDGGQYFCRVENDNQKSPVTLRVSCPQLDQFKKSLASIYLAQPEVPQDSWPPVSNKTYINLALIKQQAINYGEEYPRLTIRGDMDDILYHKEKIEYKNIFDGLKSGSLLLIEGRPGSGKTTFVHKITRDWAASEVQGPRRLVLLVSLRVLNGWEKPATLEDILQLLNMQVSPIVLQERNGKGVCFIFDGLDEFSPLEGENSIVYKMISKTYLPQSIVVVASRPAALVKLRQKADKVIEVIGFPKDQIFEYVKNYPFSNTFKADQLKSYLLSHPNVLHMCYLPIHAAMVAFLFEVMGKVPRTETEIYKHFTRFTLMRSLSKHKGQDELEDMDTGKLSGEERELFDTICEFALEKTILKKQVLDQSEMKLRLQGKGCRDISLGLVTVDRTAGLYGFKNIYTFLHLTYQEYLAAHRISTLSDEDQHKLIKQYGDRDHMQEVWKFYCGLVYFEGHEYKIKALVSGRKKIILSDIQCAYESQQKVVCDCFMKKMDAQIILKDKYLTTTDFTALGYLFAKISMPIISLSLTNCTMNTEAVTAFLKETEGKPLCIRVLYYKSRNTNLDIIEPLITEPSKLKLDVVSCSYHTQGDVACSICITRTGVDFDKVPLPASQASMLYVQGDRENYLQTLKLEVASLSTSDLESFRKYWPRPPIPKTLALQEVSWTNYKVMVKIIEFVSDFSALEKLILRSVAIDATLLADGILRHCVMLQGLELSHVSGEITSIVTGLKKCSKLQKLILNDNSYKTDGACVLALHLQYWPKLQELYLRGCGIEEEGAKAIADNIKYCPELTAVDLSENNISNKTLQTIKSSLRLHNEVTESSSPSHNEVTESSSPSHNKVTESSSPSHNEVTESSSPSHNTCCCTLI